MAKSITMPKIGVVKSDKLSSVGKSTTEDKVIYTTDDARQYIDIGGERICISDVIEVDDLINVTTPIDGKIYKVKNDYDSCLYKCMNYESLKEKHSDIDSMPVLKLMSFVPLSINKIAYANSNYKQYLIVPATGGSLIYANNSSTDNLFCVDDGLAFAMADLSSKEYSIDNDIVFYSNGDSFDSFILVMLNNNTDSYYYGCLELASCSSGNYMITTTTSITPDMITKSGFTNKLALRYSNITGPV